MADYIDKNILLQAYVHIQISASTTTRRLSEIRTELATFAEARGKFFIYPEIDVEIEFKEIEAAGHGLASPSGVRCRRKVIG